MKKLNTRGFAHQVLILAVVIIAVIGGIGSYIYLKSSSAATLTATTCKKQGGVWLDLRGKGIDHSPCWSTPGAYLVNFGAGKVGDGIDQVPLTGNNPETDKNQSQRFDYPNYIIVVSGSWKACKDQNLAYDRCTSTFTKTKSANTTTSTGYVVGPAYNLCSVQYKLYKTGSPYTYQTLCQAQDVYIQRL